MALTAHHNVYQQATQRLPIWWRCVLVAMGTIILCSCAAPAIPAPLPSAEESEALPAAGEDVAATPSPAPQKSFLPATPIPFPAKPKQVAAPCPDGGVVIAHGDGAFRAPGAMVIDPYGPLVGPSDEYVCDGGDFITPAGVREDWVVVGLEEEDAIAHYDTLDGRTIVVPSNRVCIYAPRFAAVRRVVSLMAHEQPRFINVVLEETAPVGAADVLPVVASLQRHAVGINLGERPPSLFRQRQQAGGLENLQATMDVYTSLAAYANLTIVRTGEVSAAEQPLLDRCIQSAITWTGDQAPQVVFGVKMAQAEIGVRQPGVIYYTDEPHRPRLRLLKLASRGHALPGEEVEFTLRFDNIGDQVIGNVTILDHISARLEYVPESAQSSVDANFSTEPQAGGSTVLRWEIVPPVERAEGGVLRFRARVR